MLGNKREVNDGKHTRIDFYPSSSRINDYVWGTTRSEDLLDNIVAAQIKLITRESTDNTKNLNHKIRKLQL